MVELLVTPEAQKQFVAGRWKEIAGLAWQSYTSQGRGAVILNQAEIAAALFQAKDSDLVPVPLWFFDRDTLLEIFRQSGYAQPVIDDAAKAIDNYTPTEEAVVIFLFGEESVSIYRMKGQTPPPVAAQGQKAKLN